MKIGLEKENLVFSDDFKPKNYKKEDLSENITLDFSNNQIEIISNIHKNEFKLIEQMYDLLNDEKLVNDKIWPLSMPGLKDYNIKFDAFKGEKEKYRKYLSEKYDINLMNLSGIHYNFDFEEPKLNNKKYYFELMKKIYEYIPIMLQFVSFTPVYQKDVFKVSLPKQGVNVGFENSISLRNSTKYGYMNYDKLSIDYSSLENYEKSLEDLVKKNIIFSKKELYLPIRLKDLEDGNAYLELRFIDLNPYTRLGIDFDTLVLFRLILTYINNIDVKTNTTNALENFEIVALEGNNKEIRLNISQQQNTLFNHTLNLLESLLTLELSNLEKYIVLKFIKKYTNNNLLTDIFRNEILDDKLSVLEYGKNHSYQKEQFKSFKNPNMELSTNILIEEAIKQEYEVNIINETFNLVHFKKKEIDELVLEATKTTKDNYITVSLMENKILTKQMLEKNGINVPYSIFIRKKDYLSENFFKNFDFSFFEQNKTVIKPLSSNFGEGITILNKDASKESIIKSIEFAFKYDDFILLEKFFEGEEYRFLVVNQKVVSIVKRIPANVIGDGINNILELVAIKNSNSLRSTGYKTPLEKLNIGNIERDYLHSKSIQVEEIPKKGEVIFLRENSNISTGGDSVEVLDYHSEYFKNIAIKVAGCLNAKICGIDIIIDNNYENYKVIEANFNPAIQMHTYPYKGIGKNVAKEVLKVLANK